MNTSDILWFLAIGAVFIFMMRKGGGCCGGGQGGHDDKKDHGDHSDHSCCSDSHEKEHHLDVAVSLKDPVCGMDVDKDAQGGTSDFAGTTYHFCSEHCKKNFDLDPGKYVHS